MAETEQPIVNWVPPEKPEGHRSVVRGASEGHPLRGGHPHLGS